jgi:hypothetical protein
MGLKKGKKKKKSKGTEWILQNAGMAVECT